MNRKALIIIVCLVAILIVAVAYVILSSSSSTVLFVEPKAFQETVGQSFAVNVSVSNVADLYGWQLELTWNSSLLNVTSVTEGPMLRSSGNSTIFQPAVNSTEGNLSAVCTRVLSFGSSIIGVSGDGTLMTVQFEVIGNGTCNLTLYNTQLLDSKIRDITHTVQDGQFSS
jgi:hypothetical protein